MKPLKGVKVIELAGIGPGPFAGMLLADMGADVVSIERQALTENDLKRDCTRRGKRWCQLNLKEDDGRAHFLALARNADVVFESFRPGVVERLGVGPAECQELNKRLVYGRLTGWGQEGPLAQSSGHDINYLSLTGMLHAIGRNEDKPVPPLNIIGDYAGGSLFLVMGLLAAFIDAQRTGNGHVVDAAMIDGASLMFGPIRSFYARGEWTNSRGTNLLDSGAPFYETYETGDGKYISVGAVEPKFFNELAENLKLDKAQVEGRQDPSNWSALKERLQEIFATRTRDEWVEHFEGKDVCVSPVLDFDEAITHPHNTFRGAYLDIGEAPQPAPAPRFDQSMPYVENFGIDPPVALPKLIEEWS